MSVLEAIVLGIVQGITEFLPVSSSGHLVLLQKIFKISEPVLLFDTMVHAGTLTAVLAVFWQDIRDILRKIIQPLTLFLVIGTLPTVLVALLLRRRIEEAFASGAFLGFAFLVTAALILISELQNRKLAASGGSGASEPSQAGQNLEKMTWLDALVIGFFQAVAIIPGISRSGATLSGGLLRKLDRNWAVRFAFLLSIPAILGALVLELKDLGKGAGGGIGIAPLALGTIAAAAVGFFSIRLMLKIVRKSSLWGFAAYTAVLGVLVLVDRFGTHLFF